MNKGLKSFLIMAFAGSLCLPALAREWVQVGDRHYVDVDSIKQSNEYGTYTLTTKYMSKDRPLESIDGREVWTVRTRTFLDCKTAFAKTISYTALDEKGRIIDAKRYSGKNWRDISPGDIVFEPYDYVCRDTYLKTRPGYSDLWWY